MRIRSLDHLVLTVRDLDATLAFYERLGMGMSSSAHGRHALATWCRAEFEPKAAAARGSRGDLILRHDVDLSLDAAVRMAEVEADGGRAGRRGS